MFCRFCYADMYNCLLIVRVIGKNNSLKKRDLFIKFNKRENIKLSVWIVSLMKEYLSQKLTFSFEFFYVKRQNKFLMRLVFPSNAKKDFLKPIIFQ